MANSTLSKWIVLHAGALGDLVLTLQLAWRLPRVREDGCLHIVSRVNPGDLSQCRPQIIRQSTEGLGLHWLHIDSAEPPPEILRNLLADRLVLSALGDANSLVHRRLQILKPGTLFSFDPRPRDAWPGHITDQWRRDLETQGLLLEKCSYKQRGGGLSVSENLRERGRWILRKQCGLERALLIHPGSGGREKCWPLSCFLESARRLCGGIESKQDASGQDVETPVCFVLGPVEQERWPADDLQKIRAEFPLLSSPDADTLIALLAGAGLFLGNDSGPAHLAALLGTPTATIFGPTSPTRWRPLGSNCQILVGDPARQPMDWGIHPEQVAALLRRNLSTARDAT